MNRPAYGAPRFLLDENAAGGAAAGGAAGAGGSGAGAAGASGAPGAAGGAAPAAGGAAGGAAAAGAGGGGQSDAGGNGSPSPYRPDGLPDHLFGKNDQETIDKLNGAITGFRRQQSENGGVPDKADAYSFEPSDTLKPYVANFDKDPVYSAVRDIAHKSGITDKQFKAFIPGILEHLVSSELVAAPVDANAMLREMAPASLASATDAEKQTAGARRVQDNIAWVDGAKANNTMPADVADFFAAGAAGDKRAHAAIEWLRGASAEPRPAMPAGGGSGGVSDAELQARNNDPRGNPSSSQYDKNFRAETDRMYQQRYG